MSAQQRGGDSAAGLEPGDAPRDERAAALRRERRRAGRERTVVVGGSHLGRDIAQRLSSGGDVHYVDHDAVAVDRAAKDHQATHLADLTDRRALAGVVGDASLVVVATQRDATNLLVAQHCRTAFDVSRLLVVVADPRNHDIYPADVERVCAADALSEAVAVAVDDVTETDAVDA